VRTQYSVHELYSVVMRSCGIYTFSGKDFVLSRESRAANIVCNCLVVLQFLDVLRLTDRKSLFESAWRLMQDLKEEAMMSVFDKTRSKDFIEVKWVQEIARTKTFTWFRITSTSSNFCIKVLILVNACFIILWDWPSYLMQDLHDLHFPRLYAAEIEINKVSKLLANFL